MPSALYECIARARTSRIALEQLCPVAATVGRGGIARAMPAIDMAFSFNFALRWS
jgi:hypothetical protein